LPRSSSLPLWDGRARTPMRYSLLAIGRPLPQPRRTALSPLITPTTRAAARGLIALEVEFFRRMQRCTYDFRARIFFGISDVDSTGMPAYHLVVTSKIPSALSSTAMKGQWPAIASSMELSMTFAHQMVERFSVGAADVLPGPSHAPARALRGLRCPFAYSRASAPVDASVDLQRPRGPSLGCRRSSFVA